MGPGIHTRRLYNDATVESGILWEFEVQKGKADLTS
jgi:hypothetical protein